MTKRSPGTLLENVKTIVYAGLIAIGIRTIAFEPFNIPSGSMIPTLLIGDYLFVSKYSYGYSKYSMPLAPPFMTGRIFGRVPARGDVAVFKYPRDTSEDYIKRIIGLPGDRIQMKGGQLLINGIQAMRVADGDAVADGEGSRMLLKRYIETLPGGKKHPILKASDNEALDNTREFVVPADCVFGMGDNRDNSSDSRVFGFIPMENLVGRAEFLFFSIDSTAPAWQVWEWPFEIRWSRIFSGIN